MEQENWRVNGSFDPLIGALYDTVIATTERCVWCDILPKLCYAFDAVAGSFVSHDFSSQEGALHHEYNISPGFRDAYNQELATIDPWMHSRGFYEANAVIAGQDIATDREMRQTEFYASYLAPQNLLHRLCGAITFNGHDAYFVSLMRAPETPDFAQKDKAALSELLPHLKRTMKVRDRILRDRQACASLTEFMDLIPLAFLLVSREGRVGLHNRMAMEMIARKDCLFVGAGGYLATASTKNTADLRALIAETADLDIDQAHPPEGTHFIISRGLACLPLIAVMYPVSGAHLGDEWSEATPVAMLIKDPQVERFDSLPDFASAHELTNAEARLIGLLTAGQGLFEAAGELSITKNTARTHMRNIYAKIGTNRQADLIRLFSQFSLF